MLPKHEGLNLSIGGSGDYHLGAKYVIADGLKYVRLHEIDVLVGPGVENHIGSV